MSRTVYTKEGGQVALSEQGDVQNYTFMTFELYENYGINNPVEGLKKIYSQIPKDAKPIFILLRCGSQYLAIVQATDNLYGSAIIFGYATNQIAYIRLLNGVWC